MGLYKNYVGVSQTQPACGDGSVTYAGPNCTGDALTYTPHYNASAGNPALEPTTADQLDLTYEWYFSSTGSITTALFYKKFNDYVQYGNYIRSFTNNGVTRDVSINGPIISVSPPSVKAFRVCPVAFSTIGTQLAMDVMMTVIFGVSKPERMQRL